VFRDLFSPPAIPLFVLLSGTSVAPPWRAGTRPRPGERWLRHQIWRPRIDWANAFPVQGVVAASFPGHGKRENPAGVLRT